MPNIERRYFIFFVKGLSKAKPSFEILRFVILLFCGSPFGNAELHPRCQLAALESVLAITPILHHSSRFQKKRGEGAVGLFRKQALRLKIVALRGTETC
jgi:hypothetical protein